MTPTSELSPAPDWNAREVVVFNGQHDTHIDTGEDYAALTLASIFNLEPGRAPKLDGLAFIPSSYRDFDARRHAAQRAKGEFVALCGDVDHGDHPLPRIEQLVRGFAGDAAWLIFSTAHAREDDKRWRIVIPLAQPMGFDDWHDAQHAFFNFMEYGGVEMDRALDRAGQPVYLPNIPDFHAKTGEILRNDDGSPVFYRRSTTGTNAPGLCLDGQLQAGMEAIARKREEDERERGRIRQEAERRRANRPHNTETSLIDDFNSGNSLANLFELYGYKQSPRNSADWRSPLQQGESFATRIVEGSWISLSASDAAAGLGRACAAGCFGDPYDLYVHFAHDGDQRAAFRALGEERRASRPQPYAAPPPEADPDDPGPEAPDDLAFLDSVEAAELSATPPKPTILDEPVLDPVNLWARYEAPPLPEGLLPPVIERYARAQAELMGVDPSGLAMAALAVCSATISDRITIQVKEHDPSWREAARLWVALIGPPSVKKSPIMLSARRPLCKIDDQMFRQYMSEKALYDALPSAERKGTPAPKQRRLRISDITIEAAQEVLKDSPDGVLSLQDELSGWFGAMDKYAAGKGAMADRSFWLQAFNGGPYALNRISRGAVLIPNLSISVLGGIQPEPLRKLVGEAVDDGLIQRLLPVMLAPASVGIDAPRSGEAATYENMVGLLHKLRPPHWDGNPVRIEVSGDFPLNFSPEARVIRNELEEKHHAMMATETVSAKMASHFGKYDGIFARLCVLWHCIENCDKDPLPGIVGESVARRVADFLHSFIARNAVAFYVGTLGLADDHEELVEFATHILANKKENVQVRDIQRAGHRSLRSLTADQGRILCEKLESMGWLSPGEIPSRSRTPHWAVNPIVHEKFAEHGAREAERRARARDAIRDVFNG